MPNKKPIRIAVTGPESTGKTTLALALSQELNAVYVPEFAREYLTDLHREYTIQDLTKIAEGQNKLIEASLKNDCDYVVVDTEMTVMKIWSEFKYQTCDESILEAYQKQEFDLYILCGTSIEWEFDELREHPHLRDYFYTVYKNELKLQKRNFLEVDGSVIERVQMVLEKISSQNLHN